MGEESRYTPAEAEDVVRKAMKHPGNDAMLAVAFRREARLHDTGDGTADLPEPSDKELADRFVAARVSNILRKPNQDMALVHAAEQAVAEQRKDMQDSIKAGLEDKVLMAVLERHVRIRLEDGGAIPGFERGKPLEPAKLEALYKDGKQQLMEREFGVQLKDNSLADIVEKAELETRNLRQHRGPVAQVEVETPLIALGKATARSGPGGRAA